MKPLYLLLAPWAFLSDVAFAQTKEIDSLFETGKQKFEQVCIACHKYERSPAMIAPPAFAIQMHYADRYGKNETAFRNAIVEWTKAPDKSKTLMPGAIMKFNVMPPLPLPDKDLDAIATYLFQADFAGECDTPMQLRSAER
jgi:mono/diheme cytochrome c family protein